MQKSKAAYKPLRVLLPDSQFARLIYVKLHQRKEESDSTSRVLFVTNLPPASSQEYISSLFSVFGTVHEVELASVERDDNSIDVARVTMDAASVAAVLSLKEGSCLTEPTNVTQTFGIDKWLAEYHAARPNPTQLEKDVAEFLMSFDQAEEEAQKAKEETLVDEDGFILVTRRGNKRYSGANGVSMPVATADPEKIAKKRKQDKVLDFYRFQQRQRRREELAVLREKFEEDKLRIQKMKSSRRFKPW
eukprot:c13133_g1_i1.p1 GENE.c13133_g1_i1~~c13133_g1_i1.p1  ORF type:complete len:247 (+),score=63.22 c13133_g1_i1:50-790(+)